MSDPSPGSGKYIALMTDTLDLLCDNDFQNVKQLDLKLQRLQKIVTAIPAYLDSLRSYRRIQEKPRMMLLLGSLYSMMAYCYLAQGRFCVALDHCVQAMQVDYNQFNRHLYAAILFHNKRWTELQTFLNDEQGLNGQDLQISNQEQNLLPNEVSNYIYIYLSININKNAETCQTYLLQLLELADRWPRQLHFLSLYFIEYCAKHLVKLQENLQAHMCRYLGLATEHCTMQKLLNALYQDIDCAAFASYKLNSLGTCIRCLGALFSVRQARGILLACDIRQLFSPGIVPKITSYDAHYERACVAEGVTTNCEIVRLASLVALQADMARRMPVRGVCAHTRASINDAFTSRTARPHSIATNPPGPHGTRFHMQGRLSGLIHAQQHRQICSKPIVVVRGEDLRHVGSEICQRFHLIPSERKLLYDSQYNDIYWHELRHQNAVLSKRTAKTHKLLGDVTADNRANNKCKISGSLRLKRYAAAQRTEADPAHKRCETMHGPRHIGPVTHPPADYNQSQYARVVSYDAALQAPAGPPESSLHDEFARKLFQDGGCTGIRNQERSVSGCERTQTIDLSQLDVSVPAGSEEDGTFREAYTWQHGPPPNERTSEHQYHNQLLQVEYRKPEKIINNPQQSSERTQSRQGTPTSAPLEDTTGTTDAQILQRHAPRGKIIGQTVARALRSRSLELSRECRTGYRYFRFQRGSKMIMHE